MMKRVIGGQKHRPWRWAGLYLGVAIAHGLAVAGVLQVSLGPASTPTHPAPIELILLAPEPEPEPTPEPDPEIRPEPEPAEEPAATSPIVPVDDRPRIVLPVTVEVETSAENNSIPALPPQVVPADRQADADAAVEVVRRMACLRSGTDRPAWCDAEDRNAVLAAAPEPGLAVVETDAWLPPAWAAFRLPDAPVSLEDLRERKCLGRSSVLPAPTETNSEYFLDGPGRSVGNAVTEDRGIFCD